MHPLLSSFEKLRGMTPTLQTHHIRLPKKSAVWTVASPPRPPLHERLPSCSIVILASTRHPTNKRNDNIQDRHTSVTWRDDASQ